VCLAFAAALYPSGLLAAHPAPRLAAFAASVRGFARADLAITQSIFRLIVSVSLWHICHSFEKSPSAYEPIPAPQEYQVATDIPFDTSMKLRDR
jgi:hypothetical protein